MENIHTAGYTCTCSDLYTGERCEQLLEGCLLTPCQNGGTCQQSEQGTLLLVTSCYNIIMCVCFLHSHHCSPIFSQMIFSIYENNKVVNKVIFNYGICKVKHDEHCIDMFVKYYAPDGVVWGHRVMVKVRRWSVMIF